MIRFRKLERLFERWENKLFPYKPIDAATAEEWNKYEVRAKKEKLKWFLAETLPNFFMYKVLWPFHKFDDLVWWTKYRIFPDHKYHVIRTRLSPGYRDLDQIILHGVFESLVDFVECEKSVLVKWNSNKKLKKTFLNKCGITDYRSAENGVSYLEWESKLADKQEDCNNGEVIGVKEQAEVAKEILRLYNWWKKDRPNRIDPYKKSGWSDYCENKRKDGSGFWASLSHENETAEEKKQVRKMIKESSKIEDQYYQEDTEMLISLMKIRKNLWS